MLEGMKAIQSIVQQNNIHSVKNLYNNFFIDQYKDMQRFRKIVAGTMDISLKSSQIDKSMRMALGIDQMKLIKQLKHSTEMLRKIATGNYSKVFSNEFLMSFNSAHKQIDTYKLIESASNVLKDYRTNQKIKGSWQILSYSYPELVKENNQVILENQFAYSEEDNDNIKDTNKKMLENIFTTNEHSTDTGQESSIITLSPINAEVLKYLSENPETLYQLSGGEFEIVMAEIYSKLGYDVTRTKVTRDGGKDLIIRKPEILGDFIYYVECKKYDVKRPIGVSIVRNLIGTVNIDKVNGGILATTSFFSQDAYELISDNKMQYQIKMHDYDKIRNLLNKVV